MSALLNQLSSVIGAMVSVISALLAFIAFVQTRRQSQQDEEHRNKDHELRERQATAAEKNNEEIRALTTQLAESNDPVRQEQLEAQIEEKLKLEKRATVTPETLATQLSSTRATLRSEMRSLSKRLEGRIDQFMTYEKMADQMSVMNRLLHESEALLKQANAVNEEAEVIKQQIIQHTEQGMDIEQLQRELLINIGNELIHLAQRMPTPTLRHSIIADTPTATNTPSQSVE